MKSPSNIRAIAVTAVISTAAGFGLGGWSYPSASAPDEERSSSESPVVSVTSPADSLTSPTPTTPRNSTVTKTISAKGVEIEFDEENPGAAMAKIKSLPDKQLQRLLKREVISATAQKDPQRALAMIDTSDKYEALECIKIVFDSWARQDMNAAQAAMVRLKGSHASRAAYAVFGVLAKTDPAGAVSAAVALESPDLRRSAVAASMLAWGQSDFDAALNGALGLQNPLDRRNAISSLSSQQVLTTAKKPALFAAMVENIPYGAGFRRNMYFFFKSWADEDPAAAARAALELPAGPFSAEKINDVAANWAKVQGDRSERLQWAMSIPPGEARNTSLATIMGEWARMDPTAAANETLGLPDGDYETAIGSVVRSWASSDTTAAAEWVDQLSAGSAKDRALAAVAPQIAKTDPATAIKWAESIGEESLRQRNIKELAQNWLRQDKVAAEAWISSAPISEETRKKLLGR